MAEIKSTLLDGTKDTVIVSGVPGKRIEVVDFAFVCTGTTNPFILLFGADHNSNNEYNRVFFIDVPPSASFYISEFPYSTYEINPELFKGRVGQGVSMYTTNSLISDSYISWREV